MDAEPKSSAERRSLENEIFAEALELPPDRQDSFIRFRCGADSTLLDAVLHLLSQYDRLGSFLNHPPVSSAGSEDQIPPGSTIAGRFQNCQLVGQGGMGVVYRAEDLELGETIALKMVRDIWLDDPTVLVRFKDEIRLTRNIAQRNVCRIYDLFTETIGGRPRAFFTMQFLDGQSLAERTRSGWRPDPEEALKIVSGLAAGLDAAHDAGIVHRDLKPANIILQDEGGAALRPIILDFGLAQALASQSGGVSRAGQMVGSPDYMAPEQFLSEPVTPATDIFALAAITYEMVTGSLPWPKEGLMKAALRRVTGKAPPLDSRSGMPEAWRAAIESALATDPARRPQKAGDFLRLLESSIPNASPPGLGRLFSSRRTAIIGSAAGALSLIYGIYRYHKQESVFTGDARIVLNPMEAYSGYEDSKALDFLMSTQLRQSSHVQVVRPAAIEAAWKRMHAGKVVPLPPRLSPAAAREAALFAGANFVLFSSINRTGDDYKLIVKLDQLGANSAYPESSKSKDFRATDEGSLMRATRDASVWVRNALGEVPADIASHNFHPEELTTGNWRALQEFLKAEEAWREEIHGKRADESIRRLKTALELDPGFALAAGRLGDLLVAIGQEDDGLRYQETAIELMDQRDLTDRESLRIRGLYYQDTGQDEKAENLFSIWAIEYPKEGVPLFYKAKSLMRMGHFEESVALRSKAAKMEPDNFALSLGEAHALLESGDLDGAERVAKRLTLNGQVDRLFSSIEFGRYRLDGVRHYIERMRDRDSEPYQCEAYALSACLFAEEGKWQDAVNEIQQGVRLAIDRGFRSSILNNKLILAKIYLAQDQPESARRECRQILELKPGQRRVMEVGCVLAQSGAKDLAQACLPLAASPNGKPGYLATPIYVHWRKRLEAAIAMAENRGEAASKLVSEAPPSDLLDNWPEYKAAGYLAGNQLDLARESIAALLHNPGQYWRLADTTGPGFFRWSIKQANKYRLFDPHYPDLIHLQAMLNA